MKSTLKYCASLLIVLFLFFSKDIVASEKAEDVIDNAKLSSQTQACIGCHSADWINNHFTKLEETTKETNKMTLAATKLMSNAWENKIEDKTNPFDEPIEQMWIRKWLFYSNSIRYASAMTGAPDYASFKNGWWSLSENLQRMKDWAEFKKKATR